MGKKNGWFFNKNIIEEINDFTNDEVEQERIAIEDKINEIKQLKQQLQNMTQKQEGYQADIKRLSKSLDELKDIHSKQVEELYQEKWQSEQLKNTIKEERLTVKEQSEKIENLQKKLKQDGDKTKKINELSDKIKKQNQLLVTSQRQLEETKKQRITIENQLKNQISKLKDEQLSFVEKQRADAEALEEKDQAWKNAINDLRVLREEYYELETNMGKKQDEFKELSVKSKIEAHEKDAEIAVLLEQNNIQRDQLETYEKQINEHKKFVIEMDEMNQEFHVLTEQHSLDEKTIETQSEELKIQRETITNYEKKINELESTLKSNSNHEQIIQQMRQKQHKDQEMLSAQESEIRELKEQLEKALLSKNDPNEEHLSLIEKVQMQENAFAENEKQLQQSKEQHQQLKSQYSDLTQQINHLNEERANLKNQLNQQLLENKQLEERTIKMEETNKMVNQVEEEKKKLEEQHSEEREALNNALFQAQEEIIKLEEQIINGNVNQQLVEKNTKLETSLLEKETQIKTLEQEVANAEELNIQNKDQEKVLAELKQQITELTVSHNQLKNEKEETIKQLQEAEKILREKDDSLKQLADQLVEKATEVASDPEALVLAKRQISELMEKNEALKKEVTQSQLEIGEVLFTAKRQANRTIEEAQVEAKHLIGAAELEVENIGNRAKKILREVTESKEAVLEIYSDLEYKVEQLAKGTILTENQ